MKVRINELIPSEEENSRSISTNVNNTLRVSCPGIIQSFDEDTQTVTVQLALREQIKSPDESESRWFKIPPLLDVPLVFPRSGGYLLTLPIKKGDECLVLFSDMCIDAWYSHGGIQNQIEKRRHDLSDAFAIPGIWSQPNKIKEYSTESTQLRNESGDSYIELKDNTVNIVANTINLKANTVNVSASGPCSLKGNPVTSNGLNINTHKHSCPDGTTSGPF